MTWLTWVAARPDGARIAIGDAAGALRIWAPREGRITARQTIGSRVRVAAWTADGARLIAVGEEGDLVHVFDGDGAAAIGTFATRHRSIYGLATHPSRPLVVTAGDGGHVRLWDLSAGLPEKPIHDMEEPSTGRCAAMSEALFAVGSSDGTFAAWEIEGGKAWLGAKLFGSYVAAMAFSPDGRSLVLGGGKGGILENRFDSGWRGRSSWPSHPPKPIATNAIAFHHDGRFACAHSDRTASIFDSTDATVPHSLGAPFWTDAKREGWKQEYIVSGICFVPAAKLLVTTSFDGRVSVFEDHHGMRHAQFDPSDEAAVAAAAVHFGGAKAETKPKAPGARTIAEMRFAASLRPCAKCGAPAGELAMQIGDGRCTFSGRCRFCGTTREEAIAGDCDAPWPVHELGDARASTLVTPEALLAELARSAPGEKARAIELEACAAFAARRDRAMECLLELLKHVPEGGAIARADGEPVTREQLAKALERMLALGPDDRAPPPAQPPIVDVLAKPATVGALETALGIRFTWSHLAAGNIGRLDLPAPGTPLLGPRVVRLEAKYGFSLYSEEPLATLEKLRARELAEWSATLTGGFAALRAKLGAPREVDGKYVYNAWILAKAGEADGCTLSWYAKLPDWAVAQPDAASREAALRAFAASCASATDAAGLAQAAARVPAGCGIEARAEGGLVRVALAPAVSALELARIFEWKAPVGQAFTMHLTDWQVRLVTGETEVRGERLHETSPPSFGAWPVLAELAAFPKGAMLTKVGISGTHALGPEDVVRTLLVGRS